TELDWAMKNGQTCIWAPSKIVLDAVDGPAAGPAQSVALVAWFAAQMEAAELLVVGAAAPDTQVPTRALPVSAVDLA
ncbi:MAG: diguanylate cyclase, partial [Alphaproteobacteria bacterium]|nr:diguanylate cyclase [Alphaproteobacteria bacterium]